jgi:hypothetical protein
MDARDSRRATLQPTEAERWTPAQAAEYAAARDFRLIQLLSTDRRALAAARRLGLFRKAEPAERRIGVSDRGQAATRSSASTGARSKDERPHNSRQRRSDERREAYAARMAKVDSHLRQKVFRGWKKMFDECRREQPPGNSRQMPAPDPSLPPRREPPPQLARHPHGEEQAANLPPCTTDTDVQMAEGGELPSSPRRDPAREEHAFLHAASDTLAGRRAGPGQRHEPRGSGRGRGPAAGRAGHRGSWPG